MSLLNRPPKENANVNISCIFGKWYETSYSNPIYLGETLYEAIVKIEENLEWDEHFGKWMIPITLNKGKT